MNVPLLCLGTSFVTHACQTKYLHGVLWPLRLLCWVAGGRQGSCDAGVSIMKERSPPAAGLLCGSGKALCGQGEIDEECWGGCLSVSPSAVHSQSGSLRSLSPGPPPAPRSLPLFKRPSCFPFFFRASKKTLHNPPWKDDHAWSPWLIILCGLTSCHLSYLVWL